MYKKPHYALLIIGLASFFIAVTGCRKITQSQLVGEWQAINIQDLDGNDYLEQWTFDKANNLYIYRVMKDNKDSIISVSGEYKMKNRNHFTVSGFEGDATLQYYDYTWEIIDISKSKLVIVNDQDSSAGLTFKEFERIE